MPAGDFGTQGAWNPHELREEWPLTPDFKYILKHIVNAPVDATAEDAHGRLLEVAAAEGLHANALSKRGLAAFIVEPSEVMLEGARRLMAQQGTHVTLIRGVAETLPCADHTFDRVLCDSALDHLSDPETGVREMARVAKADGRVVLSFVNYGGLTARLSRVVYGVGRAFGMLPRVTGKGQLFWDTPVPYEHNFECTLANVSEMCRPYLKLERAFGVSLGWGFPGWGRYLEGHPGREIWVRRFDRFARRNPALADFVVTVWRPRPRATWPVNEYRVRTNNPVYQRLVRIESAFWAKSDYATFFAKVNDVTAQARNRAYTGDPERSWIEDLARRGPFKTAAALGCDDAAFEVEWLQAGGSEHLDVYDLSPGVLAKVKVRLGPLAERARLVQTDLNFVELPENAYDCIWSSGTLHCVTNLEHLFTQVARALRPGGIFAFHNYVGEARLQYTPERVAKTNALFATIPARYRRVEAITVPDPPWHLSPFQAVRSNEIMALARARFDVLHEAFAARYFPVPLLIDMEAMAREDPALLERLHRAEADAHDDPALPPSSVYAVFRKRG